MSIFLYSLEANIRIFPEYKFYVTEQPVSYKQPPAEPTNQMILDLPQYRSSCVKVFHLREKN